MDAAELKRKIARLKKEKKEEEERKKLRGMEREAISEAREATRERRISGIGLAVEKAKVYKALPIPHIRPRDEEERIRKAEQRAEKAEAEAARQIALSRRRTETARVRTETTKAEAAQQAAEREAKGARLLSERELRAARMRPYTEAATKAAKVTGKVGLEAGKVGLGLGRAAWRGLEYLGKEGQKAPRQPRRETPLDLGQIDLGFGPPRKRTREEEEDVLGLRPKHKEPPLSLDIKIE